MPQYQDLLITDTDITLDVAGLTVQTTERDVIAQDFKHALLDSGLLIDLLAERSPYKWALNINLIAQLAEYDARIIPGTVIIENDTRTPGRLWIYAQTLMGTIAYQADAQSDTTYITMVAL